MEEKIKYLLGNRNKEVLIDNNFVYYPLVLDEEIEKETEVNDKIKKINNRLYVKGYNLIDLINEFDKIYPDAYQELEDRILKDIFPEYDLNLKDISKPIINILVTEVMPWFLGNKKSLKKKKLSELEVLSLIKEKVRIPEDYYKKAEKIYNIKEIEEIINKLQHPTEITFPNGLISIHDIISTFKEALKSKIFKEKKSELEKELEVRKEMMKKNKDYLATILYLNDIDEFELDNFGFINKGDMFYIYVRVGEYALRDFDGKVYLFPPCRVAVSVDLGGNIISRRPLVIDKYKHPFLKEFASNQSICILNYSIKGKTNGEKIIDALEKGIHTLLYSYLNNYKKDYSDEYHFGYHRLDGKIHSNAPSIKFDDLKISEDDERIKSGKVIITNDPFIEK